jgi:hypothetical protein
LQAQQQAQQQAVQDLVKHLVKMDGDLPDDKRGGGVERHPYERFRDNEVVTEVSSKMAGAPCTSEMVRAPMGFWGFGVRRKNKQNSQTNKPTNKQTTNKHTNKHTNKQKSFLYKMHSVSEMYPM